MVDTTQQKHTAGPWKLYDALTVCDSEKCDKYGAPLVIARIEPHTKDVFLQTANGQEAEANAAFIITACNSHYELLEACKAVINYIGNRYPYEPCVKKCREAITKAEGR